ncbi:hypothetical protein ABQE69_06770 [Mycolicibacillus trivialis]|uniref:Chitin-binding type-2 domain-containing protein n=1 Tax=Mycolicibacillus trivialis TaxID=1798 RepID=A0A1X2EP93_9MYCO|nr:hypothetical protein [Mycolicibacillus trivialis]ORX07906.1 hypothetical protein AWC30_03010 [Mycolicibacillus trivialis]
MKLLHQLAPVAMAMLAPLGAVAAVTIATPAVGSAEPLNCPAGQWWDPTANVCRPLNQGPQPLFCDNGWWWNPATNECAPPVLPPN